MSIIWKPLKGSRRRKRARCTKCDNPLFYVIWEPVARQVRSRTAHHMRVVAKCPECKTIMRLKLGPPDSHVQTRRN